MINVVVYRNNDGAITGFDVSGHAGFDDYGRDIVCAAVSSVAQTAVLGVRKVVKAKAISKSKSGYLSFELKNNDENALSRASDILETMYVGLKDIEKQYIDFLKVESRRCKND